MSQLDGVQRFAQQQQKKQVEGIIEAVALNAALQGKLPGQNSAPEMTQQWAQAPDGSWHWISVPVQYESSIDGSTILFWSVLAILFFTVPLWGPLFGA